MGLINQESGLWGVVLKVLGRQIFWVLVGLYGKHVFHHAQLEDTNFDLLPYPVYLPQAID